MEEFGRHEFIRYTLDMVATGKAIQRLRESRNLRVEEVARYLNVSPQSVYNWEAGRGITLINIIRLCWLLRESLDHVVKMKPEIGAFYDYDK